MIYLLLGISRVSKNLLHITPDCLWHVQLKCFFFFYFSQRKLFSTTIGEDLHWAASANLFSALRMQCMASTTSLLAHF